MRINLSSSVFFTSFNKNLSVTVAEYIYDINAGITYNIQYTCNKLFSSGKDKIEERDAIKMLDKIPEENEIIYNYRELLTKAPISASTGYCKRR